MCFALLPAVRGSCYLPAGARTQRGRGEPGQPASTAPSSSSASPAGAEPRPPGRASQPCRPLPSDMGDLSPLGLCAVQGADSHVGDRSGNSPTLARRQFLIAHQRQPAAPGQPPPPPQSPRHVALVDPAPSPGGRGGKRPIFQAFTQHMQGSPAALSEGFPGPRDELQRQVEVVISVERNRAPELARRP